MARVALVTTSDPSLTAFDSDREFHDRAFAERGLEVAHVPWDDLAVPWEETDLMVLRSTWDYSERLDEFLAWLQSVSALSSVSIHNPPAVVRWNLDKRYLSDLGRRGVPVVPIAYATTITETWAAIDAIEAAEVVVKPTVSVGSRATGRFSRGAPEALALAEEILDADKEVMVAPCVASVNDVGEVAVVAFDGVVSHAVRKGPILALGGGLLTGTYQEDISPVTLAPGQRAVADQANAAVASLAAEHGWVAPGTPLLYSRVDLVELTDGSWAVLEVELIEPQFFLAHSEGAAERFVDAVALRLGG